MRLLEKENVNIIMVLTDIYLMKLLYFTETNPNYDILDTWTKAMVITFK